MNDNSQDGSVSVVKAILIRILFAVVGVALTVVVVKQLTVHPEETFVLDASHLLHIAEFALLTALLGRTAKWRPESAYFSGAAAVVGFHYLHLPGLKDMPVPLAVWSALIAIPLVILLPLSGSKEAPKKPPSNLIIGALWAVLATFFMFALLHWPPVASWQLDYKEPLWRAVVGILALVISGVALAAFFSNSDKRLSGRLELWAVIVPLALLSLVSFKVFNPSDSLEHSWLDLSVGAFTCYILMRIYHWMYERAGVPSS
ncbi:MAG: hypothetical protein O7B35_11410 [Deltaproteobacteria bacterium]|nr:hypothetical protein [Deltaproteobacteria bacterium]